MILFGSIVIGFVAGYYIPELVEFLKKVFKKK